MILETQDDWVVIIFRLALTALVFFLWSHDILILHSFLHSLAWRCRESQFNKVLHFKNLVGLKKHIEVNSRILEMIPAVLSWVTWWLKLNWGLEESNRERCIWSFLSLEMKSSRNEAEEINRGLSSKRMIWG